MQKKKNVPIYTETHEIIKQLIAQSEEKRKPTIADIVHKAVSDMAGGDYE